MKAWQKNYIKNNLDKLVELTECTEGLVIQLERREIISIEESQELHNLNSNKSTFAASQKLYEILQSRINGYTGLTDALVACKQELVCKFLTSGAVAGDAEELLALKINVLGAVTPFTTEFPGITIAKAQTILKNLTLRDELRQLDTGQLKLQCKLPENRQLYIPRSVCNRIRLDHLVFRENCPDVFVFKGIRPAELKQLIGNAHFLCGSKSQTGGLFTCRHIYLEEEDHWDDLVDCSTKDKIPLHLIYKDHESFFVVRSTGITDFLRNHFSDSKEQDSKEKEAYVSENALVIDLLSHKDTKGICVCDTPGMGKTLLLENLARALSQKTLASFVGLSSLSKRIGEHGSVIIDLLLFLLELCCGSKLVAFFIARLVRIKKQRLFVCLDGFDEISVDKHDEMLQVLKKLNAEPNLVIVVSARPHMRRQLEDTLKCVSYDILPFSQQEQVQGLVDHWSLTLGKCDESKLIEAATYSIKTCNKNLSRTEKEMLGIPLKCFLLAVVNESHVRKFTSLTRKTPYPISNIASVQSICELYERFVDDAFEKLRGVVGKNLSESAEWKRSFEEYHRLEALKLLFPELADKYFKTLDLDRIANVSTGSGVSRVGVLVYNGSGHCFIHQSIAEYIVGKYFAEFWVTSGPDHENDFTEFVSRYFLTHVLKSIGDSYNYKYKHTGPHKEFTNLAKLHTAWNDIRMHTFTFIHRTVIWFMNSMLGKRLQSNEHKTRLELLRKIVKPKLKPLNLFPMDSFEHHLTDNIYAVMLCCIKNNFASVLQLISNLIKTYILPADIPKLFLAPEKNLQGANQEWLNNHRETSSVAFLLNHIASYGSPNLAQCTFDLCSVVDENYLLDFCRKCYPDVQESPLEVSIDRVDKEMALFFLDKVSIPGERLLIKFFTSLPRSDVLTEQRDIFDAIYDYDSKPFLSLEPTKIMQNVHTNWALMIDIVGFSPLLSSHHYTIVGCCYNMALLKHFLPKCNLSAKVVFHSITQYVLPVAVISFNDYQFIDFLLLVFQNTAKESTELVQLKRHCVPYPETNNDAAKLILSTAFAHIVWPALDQEVLKKSFKMIDSFEYALTNMESLETLKLLKLICKDISVQDKLKQTYLHVAVKNGNTEWVRFLIESGSNVNQRDKNGDAPLHYLPISSRERMVTIGKLLLNKGCDMDVVNLQGDNVIHKLARRCKLEPCDSLFSSCKDLFGIEVIKLWRMPNRLGETPTDILSSRLGSSHPMVAKFKALLNDIELKMLEYNQLKHNMETLRVLEAKLIELKAQNYA